MKGTITSKRTLTKKEQARRQALTEKWIFGTATMKEIDEVRALDRRAEAENKRGNDARQDNRI